MYFYQPRLVLACPLYLFPCPGTWQISVQPPPPAMLEEGNFQIQKFLHYDTHMRSWKKEISRPRNFHVTSPPPCAKLEGNFPSYSTRMKTTLTGGKTATATYWRHVEFYFSIHQVWKFTHVSRSAKLTSTTSKTFWDIPKKFCGASGKFCGDEQFHSATPEVAAVWPATLHLVLLWLTGPWTFADNGSRWHNSFWLTLFTQFQWADTLNSSLTGPPEREGLSRVPVSSEGGGGFEKTYFSKTNKIISAKVTKSWAKLWLEHVVAHTPLNFILCGETPCNRWRRPPSGKQVFWAIFVVRGDLGSWTVGDNTQSEGLSENCNHIAIFSFLLSGD